MYLCQKQNTSIPLLPFLLLSVLTIQPPPTVSSFRSWGSPTKIKFPPPIVDNLRQRTVQKKEEIVRDTTAVWKRLLPSYNNNSDDDNTKKITRELGIEYDPVTTPRLGIVELDQVWDVLYASVLFLLRSGSGTFASGYTISIIPQNESVYTPLTIGPYQILESSSTIPTTTNTNTKIQIYDESPSSPQSQPIHEIISRLGLEVEYHPCPIGGGTRNALLSKYGEGTTFPILFDTENNVELYDAGDIADYILRFWGGGGTVQSPPPPPVSPLLTSIWKKTNIIVGQRKPSNPPRVPLSLYSFEGCPYSRAVREELYRLEIVHRQISCSRGSANRQRLFEKIVKRAEKVEGDVMEGGGGGSSGRFQVPYLEDPNTGVGLFESGVIVKYLRSRYGVMESPVRYL